MSIGVISLRSRLIFLSLIATLAMVVMLHGARGTALAQEPEYCGTPTVATLFAGQTIDSGTVTVANDADNLYVVFETANGWMLSETHVHVGNSIEDIPQTRQGNPKVGNFAYKSTHDPVVDNYTLTLPLADLGLSEDDSIVVAAHAVVVKLDDDGNVIESETGWADGKDFPGKSWATLVEYSIQSCDPVVLPEVESHSETAFAFGGDLATCFLDIDEDADGNGDFNRWGWSNGPISEGSYSWDIYAGAGQCDLSKGTVVGTLDVNYAGSTLTVTYNIDAPYAMEESHVYVGSEILARDVNGEFTVAPGQYPQISEDANTYTFEVSGDVYVVAHAVVNGF